ncbi:putative N-acetylmuramoyl-L-alanine amidase [Clostridium celatum DSM 1785]|uniref:Putative N-acetylmuramoyl-L-alanine amidase n=1 Tax=Clostridium celatum DSM 1785 TaxID=545697 RepID=L1QJJ6_9CLOT|nr:putative N-acetylmuramoyl-L-alanine amidase [Clostridium celatum DSM 1785]
MTLFLLITSNGIINYLNKHNKYDINIDGGFIMKKLVVAMITVLMFFYYTMPVNAKTIDDTEKIILIDAGHGGIDGGAKSKNGTIEKDINLQIALKLKDCLEEKGYKVYMTRDSDEGLYEKGTTIKVKEKRRFKK